MKNVLTIALGIAMTSPMALFAAPDLSETRSALKEWVELKKLISQEKSSWEVEKETLNESTVLLEKEIEGLKERIAQKEADASAGDIERQKLTQQQNELTQASAVVQMQIGDLEEQILNMRNQLPESLRDKIAIITERMPKDERAAKKLSLSQRIQYVAAVLTEIEKFNGQVTLENTMQEIDGENVEVKTIYIGLAIAYYVDGTKKEAGILRPGPTGWKKEVRQDLADPIYKAVAILESEELASFINLPMTVQ